jgi:GNAT superfamily N-acetyltransferase
MHLEPALPGDIPAIVALMNGAYRGNTSGWNTEAGYIGGDRTNVALLEAEIRDKPDAAQLVVRADDNERLVASVWLEPVGDGVWYLGALTVDPTLQMGGMGRTLLAAAEDWAVARGARTIRMTVVHIRDALIAWYERRGYALTGATASFPYGDERFGRPMRDDLYFVVLEKRVAA